LNNNETILLSNLKNHQVAPPDFLFKSILNRIEGEDMDFKNTFKPLLAHAVMPNVSAISFGAIMNRIKEADELNTFKPLKDYEVKAPISFTALMEIIRKLFLDTSTKPVAKVIAFSTSFKRIAAAAAVLLILTAGYFILKSSTGNTATENNLAIAPTPTNVKDTNPNVSDSVNIVNNNTSIAGINGTNQMERRGFSKNNIFRKGNSFKMDTASIADGIPMTEMKINGSSFSIIDNDYLVTFTSFNEANLPLFLQADKPVATSITVDNYTDITITEGMAAMMKKMYKTKKSGKPTRRARKQKEKLEKWKKSDADYFNHNSTTNPLDPMDLGNFILNK
jgi:hypothetical protein